MSLVKKAVFLASRFDEFSELRRQLKDLIANYRAVQLAPIDLNDGHVSHRPPLAECLGYVRRSEFMILLLGDTYGSLAPGADKSFTQLEYEEASKEETGTRVLAFGIGDHYLGGRIRYSEDTRLADWQRQVEKNHTVGFFEPDTPVDVVAKSIVDRLMAALYEMSFGALPPSDQRDIPDELFDAIEGDSFIDDAEVSTLEERNARGPLLADNRARFTNTLTAVTQPAAVAALEQREEAQRALDIGEYGVAIRHLKRALEFKPLELISNYWLAQLYVALGRKERATEAMEMAERAGRVATRDGLPYRAAAAYVTAARAARLAGHPTEAISFAKQAVDVAPRFARGHVELARQHALHHENTATLDAIRQAFSLYPRSLREVFGDPVFRPMRKDIDALVQKLKAKISSDVSELIQVEVEIARLAEKACVSRSLAGKTIQQLMEVGRESSRRQYEFLCALVNEAEQKVHELHPSAPNLPPPTEETLRFSRSSRARIHEWFKDPNQVIAPGEAVFSFQYDDSTRVMPWILKGHVPVRMIKRASGNDSWVSAADPLIFTHIPANVKFPEVTRPQELSAAIGDIESKTEACRLKTAELQAQKEEISTNLLKHRKERMKVPGDKDMLIGAACFVIGLVIPSFSRSNYGSGIILLLGALACSYFLITKGLEKRKAYREVLDNLDQSLIHTKAELTRSTDREAQLDQELAAKRNALAGIEAACEDAKARACAAFDRFEGVTLRKGARLLPFPSIYVARAGDVARVFDRQLDQFISESRREIQVNNDFPDWLVSDRKGKSNAHLLRIIDDSHDRVTASYREAYSLERAKSSELDGLCS